MSEIQAPTDQTWEELDGLHSTLTKVQYTTGGKMPLQYQLNVKLFKIISLYEKTQ